MGATDMATTASDRIITLDTVRGVAVMGILLMNIVAFGLVDAAYMNPRAQGGATGADLWVYLFNFVLFDGKMRGLFSFLFGASMLLVIERAEAKGENGARIHYLRMVWLLLFGLAHLFLLWWGDILTHYALIGMIAFFFRRASVKGLIWWGVGLVTFQFLFMALFVSASAYAAITMQNAADPQMAKAMREAYGAMNNQFGVPDAKHMAEQMRVHSGPWWALVEHRFEEHRFGPLTGLFFYGWETLGYMLFGMAALKAGLLAGSWPRARYWKWLAIGFGIGIPAYVALAVYLVENDFGMFSVATGVLTLPTLVRPLMIVGWACLIILLMRPGSFLTDRIAATGRMAFTNYLVTSMICSTIFYGQGLGWFGELSRAQLYLVVLAVWALMLAWSKPWLERFNYGPLEWLWRTLARGRPQPMAGGALAAG